MIRMEKYLLLDFVTLSKSQRVNLTAMKFEPGRY